MEITNINGTNFNGLKVKWSVSNETRKQWIDNDKLLQNLAKTNDISIKPSSIYPGLKVTVKPLVRTAGFFKKLLNLDCATGYFITDFRHVYGKENTTLGRLVYELTEKI